MKTKYITIPGVLLMLFVACNAPKTESKKEEATEVSHEESNEVSVSEKQIKTVGIRLGKIEKRELNSVVRINGQMDLDPQKRAEVTTLVGGVIRDILVIEGNSVTAGQKLAYIENTEIVELQKNYLTTKKEALNAEQEYNRQKELSAQGAGIEKTLQLATANYEIAKARVIGLEKQLQQLAIEPKEIIKGNMVTKIPIKAPISGVINKINISIGSYVNIQSSLMNITDNSQMHCDVKVFEKDIDLVKTGQEVDLILTNQRGTTIKGVIYQINQSFENDTKAIIAHVNIINKKGLKLLPGMYVTGLINVGKQKNDAVPDDAIVGSEGKKYIFILENEENSKEGKNYHFLKTEVLTGISELGYTQITPVTKLDPSVTIVSSNAFYIASMTAEHGEH